MNSYGGLHVAGGSAALNVPAAGKELNSTNTPALAAIAASQHGDGAVSASASTGRLTLSPGVYLVNANLSLEGEFTSGTSGDALGDITLALYKGGSVVAGAKAKVTTVTEGKLLHLAVNAIIEVAQSAQDASTPTNYVSMYLLSGDASGNDVIIREGQFNAVRLA